VYHFKNRSVQNNNKHEDILLNDRPVVTCGAKSFTLTNKNEKSFNDVGKKNPVKNTWANI